MAVGVQQAFSVTAADNDDADTNINFAEGQTPASLNNSARALMAAAKGFANQITAAKTSGGSSNAYTFTSDSVAAITTLAAGRRLTFVANHTNTGASTLNVDGIGATAIRKGGANSALVANDIVSGGVYDVVYNGTYWTLLNPETGQTAAGMQPLDATLTALAALSWSSGNALVQFTAADTVSLTLAPSVTSVTATRGTGAGDAPGAFFNTTDAASVIGLAIVGQRATQANADEIYTSYYLKDSAGNLDEVARETARILSITSGAESSRLYWSIRNSGALVSKLLMDAGKLGPVTNDGLALGEATAGFSDLFGASGFVFNFNNGNVVLTHANATATLEATTGRLVSPLTIVATVSGTLVAATHRNRALQLNGNITLPNSTMAAGDWHVLRGDGSDRTITRGSGVTMYVNGTDVATATLPARQIGGVYWDTASICHLTGPVY